MALFKISKGTKSNLNNQTLTEGYCWFTPEDGKFYIDAFKNDVLTRIPLNAAMADSVAWTNVTGRPGDATSTKGGILTDAQAVKLAGIATGAEVNQNAFSNVKVGSSTIAADGKTDTLELVGSNVTLTPDTTNDKITIGITSTNVTNALGYTPPQQDTTYSNATTSAAGLMSADDKTKLNGIATGAEVNQNAFGKVKVGSTTVEADAKIDTLELVGSNVTLTPDATNDKVTIGITNANVVAALGYTPPTTNTTYDNATTSAAGLMSSDDKTKLNGIATGAEVNQNAFSNIKVGSTTVAADAKTDTVEFVGSNITITPDATNDKVTFSLTSSNVTTALGYTPPQQDTTYSAATQSAAGLMSAADKKKLDGVATGAQVNVLESVTASGTAPLTLTAGAITNKSIAISGAIADATTSAKGVVKIGDGISVTDGTISVTAANLGLSNAMHYIGTSATAVTDGGNENPTISGYSTKTAGDVIIYGNNEYVYTANNKWELLGQDGSFKTVQTAVNSATDETTTATRFVHSITQDANGVITVKTRPLPTYNNYSLPTASTTTKGGIKVGSGLTMSSETLNHSNSVTAKTAAAQSAKTLTWGGTFTLYEEKYDACGHITGVASYNMTMPSNPNTDIKQNITLATTSKAYLTGVTTAPTSTAQALTGVADTGVYLTTTAGEISAVRHSFNVSGTEKAYMMFNSTTNAIDFIFN